MQCMCHVLQKIVPFNILICAYIAQTEHNRINYSVENQSVTLYFSVHISHSNTDLPKLMTLNYVNNFVLGRRTQFKPTQYPASLLSYCRSLFSGTDAFRNPKEVCGQSYLVIFIWVHLLPDLFYWCWRNVRKKPFKF